MFCKPIKIYAILFFLTVSVVQLKAQNPYDVSTEQALNSLEAAKKKAEEMNVLVNIAVVDAGANLKSFVRMDNSYLAV